MTLYEIVVSIIIIVILLLLNFYLLSLFKTLEKRFNSVTRFELYGKFPHYGFIRKNRKTLLEILNIIEKK